MSNKPYLRFFPSDWFGSMTRLRLTGSETATYFDLIFRMCDGSNADGHLDYDIDDLALMLATPHRLHTDIRKDIKV